MNLGTPGGYSRLITPHTIRMSHLELLNEVYIVLHKIYFEPAEEFFQLEEALV